MEPGGSGTTSHWRSRGVEGDPGRSMRLEHHVEDVSSWSDDGCSRARGRSFFGTPGRAAPNVRVSKSRSTLGGGSSWAVAVVANAGTSTASAATIVMRARTPRRGRAAVVSVIVPHGCRPPAPLGPYRNPWITLPRPGLFVVAGPVRLEEVPLLRRPADEVLEGVGEVLGDALRRRRGACPGAAVSSGGSTTPRRQVGPVEVDGGRQERRAGAQGERGGAAGEAWCARRRTRPRVRCP